MKGVTDIRSACGHRTALHDMNDWPQFMNNDNVRGWGELSCLFSFIWFHCHIWVTYCFVALYWSPVFLCFFSPSLSSVFLTVLLGVTSSLFSLSVSSFYFLCAVFTPLAPTCSPPGFLSCLSTLHKLKNWYICYPSIVSRWARRWVQSEAAFNNTDLPDSWSLATHRRPNPHQSILLFMKHQSCQSIDPRGWKPVLQHALVAQHKTRQQDFAMKASSHNRGEQHRYFYTFSVDISLMLWVWW